MYGVTWDKQLEIAAKYSGVPVASEGVLSMHCLTTGTPVT